MQSTETCSEPGCTGSIRSHSLCNRHYQAEWRAAHPEKCRAAVAKSRSKNRQYYRDQNSEYRAANREEINAKERARYAENRDTVLACAAEYRRKHPQRRRDSVRKWSAANPEYVQESAKRQRRMRPEIHRMAEAARRARKLKNGSYAVTSRDVQRLLARHDNRCAYCGSPLDETFHLDHIFPIARGGSHSIGNLAPACASCNRRKWTWTVMEWRIQERRERSFRQN